MGRSSVLSNGRLAVGLNNNGFVHDFYYPYVGQENLTTARSTRHRIGLWVDGVFSWVDCVDWSHSVTNSHETMEARTTMHSEKHGIEIRTIDFVDHQLDAFCRIMTVENLRDDERDVRLFMHQVFELSSDGRSDTALYVPKEHYILTYKGRTCLLASGKVGESSFDQHAVGNYGIEGKQGTYVDAEDGELSGGNVEHGGVDSVIRFAFNLKPRSKQKVEYWVAAGATPTLCEDIHHELNKGLVHRQSVNHEHWKAWLAPAAKQLEHLPLNQYQLAVISLFTIKAHIDIRGGIVASCDSSIYNYGRDYYNYVWPRDGAYAIWPFIRLGYKEEAKSFLKFCMDTVHRSGYMLHKYTPDRSVGSTWHPLIQDGKPELAIQEDETACVIYMLGEYLDYSGDEAFAKSMFENFVIKSANFLAHFTDEITGLPHPTYDLWEEKFMTSTYTTAITYAALQSAIDMAERFGHTEFVADWQQAASSFLSNFPAFIHEEGYLRKGIRLLPDSTNLSLDDILDVSSLYGCMMYGYYPDGDPSSIITTAKRIEDKLTTPNGCIPRNQDDYYFRVEGESHSNPWPVTTLWLAQYYIRAGELDKARNLVKLIESHTLSGSMLPEQIHPRDGELSAVTPLVWSHAEYINTLLDLTRKQDS